MFARVYVNLNIPTQKEQVQVSYGIEMTLVIKT